MERLFAEHDIKRVLEFGEGAGTRWFLDRCARVTSVEIVVKPEHEEWAHACYDAYGKCEKWQQWVQPLPSRLEKAEELAASGHYPIIRGERKEVQSLIDAAIPVIPYDLIFVDPGTHLRSAMVNELFGFADIIAAHDTNVGMMNYGWSTVNPPTEYATHRYFNDGLGTTFWKRYL